MLAKQVLSQLSYTTTVGLTLILKHFPIFCPPRFMFLGLERAPASASGCDAEAKPLPFHEQRLHRMFSNVQSIYLFR